MVSKGEKMVVLKQQPLVALLLMKRSALAMTRCSGSTTSNRVISETHCSQCVAMFAATRNGIINEHFASEMH